MATRSSITYVGIVTAGSTTSPVLFQTSLRPVPSAETHIVPPGLNDIPHPFMKGRINRVYLHIRHYWLRGLPG